MLTNHPLIFRMLTWVKRWERDQDLRAIFLGCYVYMTNNMLLALDRGRFQDPVWMMGVLERFSDYYFEALLAYEEGEGNVPSIWQYVHDATRQSDKMVFQHLFLGINAHINYDLVLTLYERLQAEWDQLSSTEKEMRYADHTLVSQIITETIDQVQDEVLERYTPALDMLDKGLWRLDEWLITSLIMHWRDEVWYSAMQLLQLTDSLEREGMRQSIEQKALKWANVIAGNSSKMELVGHLTVLLL